MNKGLIESSVSICYRLGEELVFDAEEKSRSLKSPQWCIPGNIQQQSAPCWLSWFYCLVITGDFLNAFVSQWETLCLLFFSFPIVSFPVTCLQGEAWNRDSRLTWKFKHQKTCKRNQYLFNSLVFWGHCCCCRAMPWLSLHPVAQSLGNGTKPANQAWCRRSGIELPIARCDGITGFAMGLAPGDCIDISLPSPKKKNKYTSWMCYFGQQELSRGEKETFFNAIVRSFYTLVL